jgi:hypothetical protein
MQTPGYQKSIRHQMCSTPEHDSDKHGVPGHRFDLSRHISRDQKREDRKHQQQACVTHPGSGYVKKNRRLTSRTVPINQQNKPGNRDEAEDPLPPCTPNLARNRSRIAPAMMGVEWIPKNKTIPMRNNPMLHLMRRFEIRSQPKAGKPMQSYRQPI